MKLLILYFTLILTISAFAVPIDSIEDIEDDNDSNGSISPEEFDNELQMEYYDENGIAQILDLNDTLDSDDLYDETFLLLDNENVEKEKYVTPYLYAKENPDMPYELTPQSGRDAPLKYTQQTKVIIHGWLNNGDSSWMLRMKDKYFINGDFNVITVDWQHYALYPYNLAAAKTRVVGKYVAQVLISLIEAQKIAAEDIHIAGHSLGAHVAGIVGKTIQAQLGKKIGRITGLDPAGPLFEKPLLISKKKRLVKSDALFVDIIHTDGGVFGFKRSIGHADFFPNKGTKIQPGCGLIKNSICGHLRSHKYYSESINSEKFVSTLCTSWKKYKKGKCDINQKLSMGLHLDITKADGNYYLRTRSHHPYAKG